jgi:hypothetical protein
MPSIFNLGIIAAEVLKIWSSSSVDSGDDAYSGAFEGT